VCLSLKHSEREREENGDAENRRVVSCAKVRKKGGKRKRARRRKTGYSTHLFAFVDSAIGTLSQARRRGTGDDQESEKVG
jgi:hypothetical protein